METIRTSTTETGTIYILDWIDTMMVLILILVMIPAITVVLFGMFIDMIQSVRLASVRTCTERTSDETSRAVLNVDSDRKQKKNISFSDDNNF